MERTFEEFMAEIEVALMLACGLGYMDLPDWGFRDAYEDGIEPSEVATEMLTEEGFA